MLDHLSSVPSIKGGDVGDGRKDPADKETEEHEPTGSGIETVALLEDDRVGNEEEVQAVAPCPDVNDMLESLEFHERYSPSVDKRHVNRDSRQHGFLEQDGERLGQDVLKDGMRRLLSSLQGSPPSVIPGFFSQNLSLFDEQDRGVGFRDGEEDWDAGCRVRRNDSWFDPETCLDSPTRPQTEAKMHKTQKSHLQLVPETPIYPAIKGAVAGPAKGASPNLSIRARTTTTPKSVIAAATPVDLVTRPPAWPASTHKAMAIPLRSASQISANNAPAFVNGQLANVPPKNLKIKMDATFLLRAQPTWKPM
jgi:hypothetical protein